MKYWWLNIRRNESPFNITLLSSILPTTSNLLLRRKDRGPLLAGDGPHSFYPPLHPCIKSNCLPKRSQRSPQSFAEAYRSNARNGARLSRGTALSVSPLKYPSDRVITPGHKLNWPLWSSFCQTSNCSTGWPLKERPLNPSCNRQAASACICSRNVLYCLPPPGCQAERGGRRRQWQLPAWAGRDA